MTITRILAGLTVTDEAAAERWYTALFGRGPDDRPMEHLLEWHLAETFGVQVYAEPERAGRSSVVLDDSDLDARAEALTAAGIDHDGPQDATSVRILPITDPDGNRIVFAGPLAPEAGADAGRVVASASMSLDGYVALPDDTIGRLFDWLGNGEVAVETHTPGMTFHLTAASAAYWHEWTSSLGALVVGRRLFDITDGWQGRHTLGVPVVVVTHEPPADWGYPDAQLEFVTEGVAAAVARARELAGGRSVGVAAGTIATQCLALGLLDEVRVDLVPEVLGAGKPYVGDLGVDPLRLGEPTTIIPGQRVTHLVFPVERPDA